MLIRPNPAEANHRLSARVENRGPWITTMVPPSTTSGRPVTAARKVGQYGSAKSPWTAPGGAVAQLVGHHHRTRTVVGVQAADGARAENPPHAELAQRPHVGAVRHG